MRNSRDSSRIVFKPRFATKERILYRAGATHDARPAPIYTGSVDEKPGYRR